MITRESIETLLKPLLDKKGVTLDEILYRYYSMNIEEFLQLCEKEYDNNITYVRKIMSKTIDSKLEKIIFQMRKHNHVEIYKYILNEYIEKIYMISEKELIQEKIIKGIVNAFDNISVRIPKEVLTVQEVYEEFPALIDGYMLIIEEILKLTKDAISKFKRDFIKLNKMYGISEDIIDLTVQDLHTIIIETSNGKVEYNNYVNEMERVYYLFIKELNSNIGKKNYIYTGKEAIIENSYVWSKYVDIEEIGGEDVSRYLDIGRIICLMYVMNYMSENNKDDIYFYNGRAQIASVNRLILNTYTDKYNIVNEYIKNSVDSFNIYTKIPEDKAFYVVYGFEELYNWIKENKDIFYNLVSKHFYKIKYMKRICIDNILSTSIHPYLLESIYLRKLYLIASLLNGEDNIEKICKRIWIGDNSQNYILAQNDENKLSYLDNIKKKIDDLCDIDLNKQRSIILAKCNYVSRLTLGKNLFNVNYDDITSKEIVCDILDKILDKSIKSKEDLSWIITMGGSSEEVKTEEVDIGLYTGISGIMFTYYYAYRLYNKVQYLEVAKTLGRKIYTIIDILSEQEHYMQGSYTGTASGIYVLLKCKGIISDDEMKKIISKYLVCLDKSYKNMISGDNMYGLSGVLSILDLIRKKNYSDEINNMSEQLIKNIVKKIIQDMKCDTKFKIKTWDKKGYIGYAHGSAGVSSQLLRVYRYVNDNRLIDIVNNAIKLENNLYYVKENNWFRDLSQEYCNCGWCHGAPGILLNRVQLLKLGFKDDDILEDVKKACKKVMSNDIGKDVCLCHGDFGNLIILQEVADYFQEDRIYEYIEDTYKKYIYNRIIDESKKGGVIDRFEDCGLMCGLSSVAYGIMKLENCKSIPNILFLE